MDLQYIDIGVNLMGKQFDKDREVVVRDSLRDGVGLIITGTDLKSNQSAVDYIREKKPEKTWCTCGIHPHNADRWNDDCRGKLEAQIRRNRRELCRRAVVHCFTGTRETAYRYLQLGCYIGITGWICDDRRNRDVAEAVKVIPLERLMIETDAPYLTPLNIRGLSRRNVPANIMYVAERIAQLKGVDVETVKKTALETTRTFFTV